MWLGLVNFLAQMLLAFKGLTGSYGIAIILLTIVVRLFLLPLTIKQNRSMKDMQRLQPKIKEIQAKHKNDKKKQQEEHLKLMTEHGVNPLGGCLPMVLQGPVFFALYSVLRTRKLAELKTFTVTAPALAKVGAALSGASFLGVGSLGMSMQGIIASGAAMSAIFPYGVLVVLMVVSQFFYSKAMGSADKSQATMMNMMLVFMGYLAFIFPAGLIIYWVTGNVIGIAEHYFIAKTHPVSETAKEVKKGAKK